MLLVNIIVNMNMTSIGIADFKGCQRAKIMSISLFQAGLFPKYKKIVCLLDKIYTIILVLEKRNLNANKINILIEINILFESIFLCVEVTM